MAAVREGERPDGTEAASHSSGLSFASPHPAQLLGDKGRPHRLFTPSSSPFQPSLLPPTLGHVLRSFSRPPAHAEPLTGVSLRYVPKWVTCGLGAPGDSAGGDSPSGHPSAAPSAGCPGGRRRCYSGSVPAKGRGGVTPRGSPTSGQVGELEPLVLSQHRGPPSRFHRCPVKG